MSKKAERRLTKLRNRVEKSQNTQYIFRNREHVNYRDIAPGIIGMMFPVQKDYFDREPNG